jgi:integrase
LDRIEDLERQPDGSVAVLIPGAKIDPELGDHPVFLAPDTVARLDLWLDRARLRQGPVFRRLRRGGKVGGPLNCRRVAEIFRQRAIEAGLPQSIVDQLSGHSARVGMAQDLIAAGESLLTVMQAGRWRKAEMPSRYTRFLSARCGVGARLAECQRRAVAGR